MSLDNYETLENGVIRQINVNKIKYDFEYSSKYNSYGEKSNISYLRLGVLLGVLSKTPESLLDVGYGNGDFLKTASTVIKKCYGADISNYPVPENCTKVDLFEKRHYDVISFFDSLEHFDDIHFIDKLDCNYIYISVPWCHNFTPEWFLQWYHKRENEHLWHFNKSALIRFFNDNNYKCIYSSSVEDIIRRNPNSLYYPNILTCIFKKQKTIYDDIFAYYKNKKILVTGGTGFIGRNIVNELLKYNVGKIYIFDRTIKYRWDINCVIDYIEGNLLSDMDKISELDFDIAFHQAANVDTTCIDVENMTATNVDAFVTLAHICNSKNAKLIYASSAAVYGNAKCPNYVSNETPILCLQNAVGVSPALRIHHPIPTLLHSVMTSLHPLSGIVPNVYSESKLSMDNYVIEHSLNFKIPIIGIRYFNVYGNCEQHKGKMMSMVSQIINKVKNNEDVDLSEFREQQTDFVYVNDVAEFNIFAGLLENTGIHNCGYGEYVDFNKIFNIVHSYFKKDSKVNHTKNDSEFFKNDTKLYTQNSYETVKFTPKYNIVDGIYDYLTSSREN